VTVTDGNNCTATHTATVLNQGGLSGVLDDTDVVCYGQDDGIIDLTVSGGAAPFTYSWSNSATTEDLSSLPPGTYTVTIIDSNTCQTTASAIITQPDSLDVTYDLTAPTCYDDTDGAIDLTVTGGTPDYNYVWSSGQTTQDLSGIGVGTYTITVTDANLCEKIVEVDFNILNAVTVNAVSNTDFNGFDMSCNGGADGEARATVGGGTAPYTYLWSDGAAQTTQIATNLGAGTYTVTVTDTNNCEATASITLNEPPSSVAISGATPTHVLCKDETNGSIDLEVENGVAPYTYLWNTTTTTQDLSGLGIGTYTVTVSDDNSCTVTTSVTINEPLDSLRVDAGLDVDACAGNNTVLTALATGGLDCEINLVSVPIQLVGGQGSAVGIINENNFGISINGNGWNALNIPQTINANTVLEFEFMSIDEGEEHSIGFVNTIASGVNGTRFQLYGTQGSPPSNAISDFTYNGSGAFQSFTIPIGTYFTGTFDYIVFTNDNDANQSGGNSSFRNVRLVDGSGNCESNVTGAGVSVVIPSYNYQWSTGATTETLSVAPLTTTTYTVTVTDVNNCEAIDEVTVTIIGCVEICDDGVDNDGDGFIDCLDPDCAPIANDTTLVTCDNSNNTGQGTFFLHDANPTVSTESGVMISYHVTVADANNGINTLSSPYNSIDGTVYARVERISTGCYAIANITLDVGVKCPENCGNGEDEDGDGLIDCDDPDCPCCKAYAPTLNGLNKNDEP